MTPGHGPNGRARRGPTAQEWGNAVFALLLLPVLIWAGLLFAAAGVALHCLVIVLPRLLLRHVRAVREAFGAGAPSPADDGPTREPYLHRAGGQALRALWHGLREAYAEELRAALRIVPGLLPPEGGSWRRTERFVSLGIGGLLRLLRVLSAATAVLVSALLALPALLCQLLLRAVLLAAFRLWWTVCRAVDRLGRRLTGAAAVCPHPDCGRAVELPDRLCPGCGARHRRMLPDRHGGLRRTCRCGVRLPAGTLFGARRLETRCPHCSRPVPPGGAPARTVLVAGAPRSGRSTVVRGGFAHLAGVVGPLGGRVGGTLPGTAAAELTGLRGGRRTLVLLDPPGPVFAEQSGVDTVDGLRGAHGLVLVLDALTLPSVRRALTGPVGGPPAPGSVPAAERVLRAVDALPRRRRPRRIAVVLTRAAALRATPAGPGPGDGEEAVRGWLEEAGAGNLVRLLDRTGGRVRFLADGPAAETGPALGGLLLWTAGIAAAPRRLPVPRRIPRRIRLRPDGGPRVRRSGGTARARRALLLSHLAGLAAVPAALTLLFTGSLPPTAAFGLPAAVDRWLRPLPDFAREVDLAAFRGDGSWPAFSASYSAPGSSPDGPRDGKGGTWSTYGSPYAVIPDAADAEEMADWLRREEWLEIGFGSPVPVSRIELDMEPGGFALTTVRVLTADGTWVDAGRERVSNENLLTGLDRRFELGLSTSAIRILPMVLPGQEGARITRLRVWSSSTALVRPRLAGTDLRLTNTAHRDVSVDVLPPALPPGWRAEPGAAPLRRLAAGATATAPWHLTADPGARPGPIGYAVRVTEDGRTATATCFALLRPTPEGPRAEPLTCDPA
ncbi:hypothetical protein ACFVFS_33745 [Kitasatospora sp. NPDC057692]|uniref:COG1470 family protein n=1 Tax=Kitasatospora sp. NPDC057692 TaxID=3346215 RepID=UPI0036AE3BFA